VICGGWEGGALLQVSQRSDATAEGSKAEMRREKGASPRGAGQNKKKKKKKKKKKRKKNQERKKRKKKKKKKQKKNHNT